MKVKISQLVMNYNLYPRNELDPYNLHRMELALKAGKTFPPIIADKKSNIVIDGFHRITVLKNLYGDDVEIEVEYRTFENWQEMFLEAVRLNNIHGKPLSMNDRSRVREVARSMRIKPEAIADVLAEPIEDPVPMILPFTPKVECCDDEKPIVIRRNPGIERKISDGNLIYTNRLIKAIENDLIKTDDSTLMGRLRRLHILLSDMVVRTAR